ncbi:MAG: hypothetical protein U5K00_19380 [Melioribacteraceae bacterium]|nr:hypothetical protein [Melioribacteraceae bacterium]
MSYTKEEALKYHSEGRRGKIEVVATKPCFTSRELSLAYSPGVAEPCREIEKNDDDVFKYTAKGNLVAVVSNGTAVLGLGEYWTSCRQTRYGRKGSSLQKICRY